MLESSEMTSKWIVYLKMTATSLVAKPIYW